jgi:GWxTD domain-containing protein
VTVGFDGVPDVVRSQPFELTRTAAPDVVEAAPAASSELREYFQRLPVGELAKFDAVAIWMTSEQARRTYRELTADGKREYLAEFFLRLVFPVVGGEDVTGTEALRLFLERTREVERNFAERTGEEARPAWQTDRGRIVMLRGMPASRIRRLMHTNNTSSYEIWYYNIGSGYVYLFADESSFGHYRLIYSTDPTQVTLPDWPRRVGPAAITELRTYYGIREDF